MDTGHTDNITIFLLMLLNHTDSKQNNMKFNINSVVYLH
ncbi:hypothetical protein SALWKB12_0307 [Snodgrassella communis]|uniref:Uncharacterized protein n=1 Tax=Snodgrassella communis TaxID=2946699 RepID=A0A836MSZ0_9NEIS|nr:hypothetical protein SALWKB12_0307 [Snodgrassella communis]KDN15748.1 hypothetical protein SALWKB29_0167 [Snodgrassella communis]